ncbi:MAG: replicative DNA helicase [Planctomycetota bacterium]|jgi:replicative DNA helicase
MSSHNNSQPKVKSTYGAQLRVPPQNTDAEQALLGSILMRPASLHEVADLVSNDSYYISKHGIIYEVMMELHAKSEPIDLLSVASRLKELQKLDMVGGAAYLTQLAESVPSSANVTYYAKLVADKSSLRELIEAGSYIADLGFDEKEDIEEVMDLAEKRIFSVTQSPQGNRFIGMKEVLPQVWSTIERLQDSTDELRGVPTGFPSLDAKLSGLQKADLIILAARPSVGKTSLALDIVRNAAVDHGKKVGFFSLEMSAQSLVDRMLSAQSQVDSWKMRTGKTLKEHEFQQIQDAMSVLSQAPIYIDDQPGNSILRMRSTARRLKREHGLDLIVVDYMQLMTTSKHYDNMVNQVTEISRSLKSLARELDVPVLTLSQLSRAVESRGGKPRLSDLRDSGSIEQDADVVMFIHREDRYKDASEQTNIAEIMIEKHRNGPTGTVELYFDQAKTSFIDMSKTDGYEGIAEQIPGGMKDTDDIFATF